MNKKNILRCTVPQILIVTAVVLHLKRFLLLSVGLTVKLLRANTGIWNLHKEHRWLNSYRFHTFLKFLLGSMFSAMCCDISPFLSILGLGSFSHCCSGKIVPCHREQFLAWGKGVGVPSRLLETLVPPVSPLWSKSAPQHVRRGSGILYLLP